MNVVIHHNLTPASEHANQWKSICPVCLEGMLLVMRDPTTGVLQEFDCCTLCGTAFQYADIEEMRAKDRGL